MQGQWSGPQPVGHHPFGEDVLHTLHIVLTMHGQARFDTLAGGPLEVERSHTARSDSTLTPAFTTTVCLPSS